MSSNTPPSGFRNPFSRRHVRDQEQNSTSESNLRLRPDSPLPSATSPGFRERILDTFRPKSRKQSPNPPALRAESSTPEITTSVPVAVTLHQPTTSLGDAITETEDLSSKQTNAIEEVQVAEALSRASKRVGLVCKGLVHLAKRIEPLLEGTPFQMPIAVFTAIAEVVENVKDMNDSADKAFEDLVRLLVIMERTIKETEDSESLNRIDTFASFLVSKAQDVYNIQQTPWWKKTIDIENYQEMVDGVMKELGQETKHLFVDISLAVERDTKLIRRLLESIERKEWLRAPTAMYDSDTAKDAPKRGPCTEGTRIEVLERIRAWTIDNSPSAPPIFWLSGRAGTGKSTIAYSICKAFDTGNIYRDLGASFFCSRQVDDLRRLGNIVPTLAYQLARHSSSFAKALSNVDHDAIHNSAKHIAHLLVHPWRLSSKDRPDDIPPTLIVIDALDEIDEDGGPKLLRSLIEIMAEVGPSCMHGLKILITSRPHPYIVDMAQSLSREAIYHLEDIEKETGKEDIMKFLVDSLPELRTSYRDELEGLADLSNGLFIYAATVVRLISRRDLSTKQKAKRISDILREQNTHPLEGETRLPIDSIYADIIDESIRINHAAKITSFRITALHCILCAFQPLSILELASFISKGSEDVDPEAVRLLIDDLHAVTYISNDRIYTYHKSFSDYLFDEQRCGPEITCRPDASHRVLAQGCFRIMKRSLRFNICRLPSSYLLDSEVDDLHESISRNITSVIALEYACRHSPSHLMKVPTSRKADRSLLHEMLEFTQSEKVLFWIEVMNPLSIKATCYNGVSSVVTWVAKIQEFEDKVELQLALTAVSLLVKSFLQTPASQSTPHLYLSSLAAEFASNPDMPTKWRAGFSGLPCLHLVGISYHGGVLMKMDVGSEVYSVAFSADGQRVVSSGLNMRIWDASTGKELQELVGHTGYVNSVAFSADSRRIVSGSEDKSVCIWDASTGEELQRLEGHIDSVASVAFSADGKHICSGSYDKSVRIWDASSGKELQNLETHSIYVNSVAISADGRRIVSGSYDSSVRIWDTSTGKELKKLKGHTHPVTSVAFSTDGQRVVSGSWDHSVRIWDASIGKELQKMEGHTRHVNSVAISADGQRVVSGSDDRSVRIWDASTGKELQEMKGHTDYVTSVALSTDGQRVVSGSVDMFVRIWDASIRKVMVLQELEPAEGHTRDVTSAAFSTDGQHVVSGLDDGSARICDASTGKELQKLEGHTGPVTSVAFSFDGHRVISGSRDKSVRIWNASTGKELQKLEGHVDTVRSVAFSTDGQRVVSGSRDKSVRIWNASTGKELQKLEGHVDTVSSVAFSTDGQCVVSVPVVPCSFTQSVRIWDASTGKELQKMDDHIGTFSSIAFSTDGWQRVVSCSDDRSVRIWDAPTGIMETFRTGWTSDRRDNWVTSKRTGHRFIWLPAHLHPGLCNRYTRRLTKPYTVIDFSSECLGSDWTKCYIGSER